MPIVPDVPYVPGVPFNWRATLLACCQVVFGSNLNVKHDEHIHFAQKCINFDCLGNLVIFKAQNELTSPWNCMD